MSRVGGVVRGVSTRSLDDPFRVVLARRLLPRRGVLERWSSLYMTVTPYQIYIYVRLDALSHSNLLGPLALVRDQYNRMEMTIPMGDIDLTLSTFL